MPPLSARVIVTVVVTVVALETAQLVKPLVSSTVGLAGTVKTEVAFGKAIVIVSPVCSEPVALGGEADGPGRRARWRRGSSRRSVTVLAGVVAAAIMGAAPTMAAVVSTLVLTVQLAAAGEPAAPLVIPRI